MRIVATAALAATVLLSLSLSASSALRHPAAGHSTAARVEPSQSDLYLAFDGGTGNTPRLASQGTAAVRTVIDSAAGGTVLNVTHEGAGMAARFEPFDPESPAELAVLVVRPADQEDPFAPGWAGFTFGAAFNLDATSEGSEVDNGNNLLQRGLYGDDQFKLQLDGQRLSCRVTGSAGSVLVVSSIKVTPGRWHRAECTRTAGEVTLALLERTADGVVTRRWTAAGEPGDLAFETAPPLSVGGKVSSSGEVVRTSSDQFNGRIDNVFFRRLDG